MNISQGTQRARDAPFSSSWGRRILTIMIRGFCNSGVDETQKPSSSLNTTESSEVYNYESPFWKPLRRVKVKFKFNQFFKTVLNFIQQIMSIASLAATMTSAPVLLYMDNSASFSSRIGMVMTVGVFSLFTTSMLHWFASPYICFLRHDIKSASIEVQNVNLYGAMKRHTFNVEDIKVSESMRPLVTFEAKNKPLYLDVKHFKGEIILKRLEDIEEESSIED